MTLPALRGNARTLGCLSSSINTKSYLTLWGAFKFKVDYDPCLYSLHKFIIQAMVFFSSLIQMFG
jgi:hypothetical protein